MMVNSVLMTFGERSAYAGRMILIGMGAIFLSLAVLWGVLEIFRRFVNGPEQEDEAPTPTPAPAPVPVPVAPARPQAAPSDDALIAAITAAVAATLAEENGGVVPGFRVVSFRKATTVSKRK